MLKEWVGFGNSEVDSLGIPVGRDGHLAGGGAKPLRTSEGKPNLFSFLEHKREEGHTYLC